MARKNNVKERYIYLSPTVAAGWEDESNMTDFQISKLLGKGAFGEVVKVTHQKTQLVYAIKQINKRNLKENNMIQQVSNEVKIMYSLTHPNILKLYNHFEDDENIYLVLQFAPGGQLYSMLWKQPGKKFEEQKAALWTLQLASALEYIHSQGIIHRDIKPENLLIDGGNNLKLADFGWSNFMKRESGQVRTTFCGTLDYLAPEMLEPGHKHDFQVDIWSLGVLTYELLSGTAPFSPAENQNNQDYVDQKTRANITSLNIKFPSEFSNLAQDFISKILIKDPSKRPNVAVIKSHLWIANNCGFTSINVGTEKLDKKIEKFVVIDTVHGNKNGFTEDEIMKYAHKHSIINKSFDVNDSLLVGGGAKSSGQINESFSSQSGVSGSSDYQTKLLNQLNTKVKNYELRVGELDAENKRLKNQNENLKKKLELEVGSSQGYSNLSDQENFKKIQETNEQLKQQYDILWSKLLQTEDKLKLVTSENDRLKQSGTGPIKSDMSAYLNQLKDQHNK